MPPAFCHVRTAYSYVAQVDYLRVTFQTLSRETVSSPQVQVEKDTWALSYPTACENALEAVQAAINSIRRYASCSAFRVASTTSQRRMPLKGTPKRSHLSLMQ